MGCTKSTPSNPNGVPVTVAGATGVSAPAGSGDCIEFGYWGIKGFGETCRWVLLYLGIPYKEWNPASPEEWGKKKPSTGAFPNLPYIKDGSFYLSETSAIPQYLINKACKPELLGKNLKDKAALRTIEGVLDDIKAGFMKVIMGKEDRKEALGKTLADGGDTAKKIAQISNFLGTKEFLLGYTTLVDIEFAYLATLLGAMAISLQLACPFGKHANLKQLIGKVLALPGIRERVANTKQVPFMPPQMFPFPLLTAADIEKQMASK
jgi:glutathione S-transferase